MKKFALILIFLAGICNCTMAQNTVIKDTSSKSKKNSSTGITKTGNPDMRYKSNKETKVKQAAQPTPATTPVPSASPADMKANPQTKSNPTPSSSDKVIGKDAKGRSILQGPKGGQYIINSSGNKEYIKKG